MNRLALLCTLVAAQTSFALTSNARLLADEAPVSASSPEAPPSLLPSGEAKLTPTAATEERLHWGFQFMAGAAAAIIFVPASLYLAEWLGSGPIELFSTALPALLSMGLLPPLAITLACWLTGLSEHQNPYRFWPSLLVNLVINGVSLAIAASFGLSVGVIPRVVLYTIVQAVIQPASTTMLMREFTKNNTGAQIVATHDPISPTMYVVPASSWSF